jgi:hypothetical protein
MAVGRSCITLNLLTMPCRGTRTSRAPEGQRYAFGLGEKTKEEKTNENTRITFARPRLR